jgi:hypothetical protein
MMHALQSPYRNFLKRMGDNQDTACMTIPDRPLKKLPPEVRSGIEVRNQAH